MDESVNYIKNFCDKLEKDQFIDRKQIDRYHELIHELSIIVANRDKILNKLEELI